MTNSPSTRTLFLSYLALLTLLLLTAFASSIEPRWLATSLSLGIALAKAIVILLFFMHLYYRPLRFSVIALASLVWLAFLFFITLADYFTRGTIGVPGK